MWLQWGQHWDISMFCCSTKVIPHFLIIVPYASTVVIKGKQIPLGRKRLKFLSSINMRVFSTAAAALAVFGITSGLQQPLAMDTFPLKYQAGDEVLVKASKYLNAPLSGLTEEIRNCGSSLFTIPISWMV